jgi:hypothetical protein
MKKLMKSALLFGAVMAGTASFAQIQEEENVTVTMELIPILQLNMNTSDQVNFVFDEIGEYIGGITKYGATILTVSSSVNWDLFASGTSQAHQSVANADIWDAVYTAGTIVVAGPGAYNTLPLTALELRQFPGDINAGADLTATGDYRSNFAPVAAPTAGTNNIYVSTSVSPYAAPPAVGAGANNKYIAGGAGVANYVNGGSYLTQTAVGALADAAAYYFIMDYRIVPGLPAQFNHAASNAVSNSLSVTDAGAYAASGLYTMNVKYLLIANQ